MEISDIRHVPGSYQESLGTGSSQIVRGVSQAHRHAWERVGFQLLGLWEDQLQELGQEYGIQLIPVEESGTSIRCSICGDQHPNARLHRGLYRCSKFNRIIHADLNAARNILALNNPWAQKEADNGLKTQPLLLGWDRSRWVPSQSAGTLALKGGEEVRNP